MARKKEFSVAIPMLLGLAGGQFIASILKSRELDRVPDRIEQVQEHNTQLYEQLRPNYSDLGQLILNDETDTYEFYLTPESERPQTCEGEYKVTDGVAQLTGDIACTTTVAVGEN